MKRFTKSKVIIADTAGLIDHVGYNTEGYTRALVDNELLSKCDQVIMTKRSTFGILASMKFHEYTNGRGWPYFVSGSDGTNVKCKQLKLGYERFF